MAKFISASFVLVLLVVTTMINGAYSAAREDDMPPELQKLCDDWYWKCYDDPNSVYCDLYKSHCSIALAPGSDSPPKPESTLP